MSFRHFIRRILRNPMKRNKDENPAIVKSSSFSSGVDVVGGVDVDGVDVGRVTDIKGV